MIYIFFRYRGTIDLIYQVFRSQMTSAKYKCGSPLHAFLKKFLSTGVTFQGWTRPINTHMK